MFTLRKRHLRKKRFFLPTLKTFALFNGSNLTAAKISKIKLFLQDDKLYFVPLYLTPPKLGAGCPLIMIIYKNLNKLQKSLFNLTKQMNCLGVSIEKKWYPLELIENDKIKNLKKKTLALFIIKQKKLKKTSEKRDSNPQL